MKSPPRKPLSTEADGTKLLVDPKRETELLRQPERRVAYIQEKKRGRKSDGGSTLLSGTHSTATRRATDERSKPKGNVRRDETPKGMGGVTNGTKSRPYTKILTHNGDLEQAGARLGTAMWDRHRRSRKGPRHQRSGSVRRTSSI